MPRIFMDDPEAADLLTKKLNRLLLERDQIKARDHKTWELSNLGATIRIVKQKLETLEIRADKGITLERRTTYAGNRKSFYYIRVNKDGQELKPFSDEPKNQEIENHV